MPLGANFGSFSENLQFSSIIKKFGQKDRTLLLFIHLSSLCANYHIISCIKQIMLASTTRLFPVSSKSCLQVLPCHFPYQANHVWVYYHILSDIKQIICVNLHFYVGMLLCIQVKGSIFRFRVQGSKFPFLFNTILGFELKL